MVVIWSCAWTIFCICARYCDICVPPVPMEMFSAFIAAASRPVPSCIALNDASTACICKMMLASWPLFRVVICAQVIPAWVSRICACAVPPNCLARVARLAR
jgi:hypothetical protein